MKETNLFNNLLDLLVLIYVIFFCFCACSAGFLSRMFSQYSNDTQIKVFDLRMHRMIASLPVHVPASSSTGVGYVRLIPEVDSYPTEFTSVLLCTDDGIVQVGH